MNLKDLISTFFKEENYDRLAERVVVMRHDGISIYSNTDDSHQTASIGALVSGLWQAAESLSSFIKDKNNFQEFRLSFDTSESGLYVLPFLVKEQTYYLCSIYKDVQNPGKLKRHLITLRSSLEVYLSDFSFDSEENRKGYLFNEISDDEMDRLFSFGEAK